MQFPSVFMVADMEKFELSTFQTDDMTYLVEDL